MKIAISSTGKTLADTVDPRFGRCVFFLIVETDDLSFDVIANDSGSLGSGAGIQTAQMVAHKGVKAVLTGNCGPNAHGTLSAAGIDVFVGCTGIVSDVVARFQAGEFSAASAPNVVSHSGMGGSGR